MANSISKTIRFIGLSHILDSITDRNDDQYIYFEFEAFTFRKGVRDGAFVREYFHPSVGWQTIYETRWDGTLPQPEEPGRGLETEEGTYILLETGGKILSETNEPIGGE